MIKKGVRIGRPFPPFYDWCRISTGTSTEVDRFIKGMKRIIYLILFFFYYNIGSFNSCC